MTNSERRLQSVTGDELRMVRGGGKSIWKSIWGSIKKAAKWAKDHIVGGIKGGVKWIGVKWRF